MPRITPSDRVGLGTLETWLKSFKRDFRVDGASVNMSEFMKGINYDYDTFINIASKGGCLVNNKMYTIVTSTK